MWDLVRTLALMLLRHYPTDIDIAESAVALPRLWAMPVLSADRSVPAAPARTAAEALPVNFAKNRERRGQGAELNPSALQSRRVDSVRSGIHDTGESSFHPLAGSKTLGPSVKLSRLNRIGRVSDSARLIQAQKSLLACGEAPSPVSQLTLAFEAGYLCCVEIAALRAFNLAAVEHPCSEVIRLATEQLALGLADVEQLERLRDWRLYALEQERPCSPAAAIELAQRILESARRLLGGR
ncbi:hypothetical protein AWB80_01335 [Caballeronia pedi]|uniref:Uncharacterized protein n=2 Tax=Caballeronia pedi TaxID=1777141 RepID=A0A157ZUW3_9BURK|nr:hypothetical protein AWB80_01335 [Caballeronia pedi]